MGQIRTVYVIGIGAGDPDFLTVQAIRALNATDVFFFVDKPNATGDLATLRAQICERFIDDPAYRIVHAAEVERDRTATGYADAVTAWRERRAALYERLIRDELGADGTGALLVWGDPTLYDGTLEILGSLAERITFDCVAIPGISSVQALSARHRIAMNRTGEPVHITTGRRLAAGDLSDNTFVLLDGECAFADLDEPGLVIYWGAYLGTPDEVLIAGPLDAVRDTVLATRAQLRAAKGWIMDTYLLRRESKPAHDG